MTMPESVRPWDTFECDACDQEVDAEMVDWVRWEDEYDGAPDAVNRHVCLECSEIEAEVRYNREAREQEGTL